LLLPLTLRLLLLLPLSLRWLLWLRAGVLGSLGPSLISQNLLIIQFLVLLIIGDIALRTTFSNCCLLRSHSLKFKTQVRFFLVVHLFHLFGILLWRLVLLLPLTLRLLLLLPLSLRWLLWLRAGVLGSLGPSGVSTELLALAFLLQGFSQPLHIVLLFTTHPQVALLQLFSQLHIVQFPQLAFRYTTQHKFPSGNLLRSCCPF